MTWKYALKIQNTQEHNRMKQMRKLKTTTKKKKNWQKKKNRQKKKNSRKKRQVDEINSKIEKKDPIQEIKQILTK